MVNFLQRVETKKMFTQKLASNIKKALVDFPQVKVIPDYDFMYLDLHEAPEEAVIEKVKPNFWDSIYFARYILLKKIWKWLKKLFSTY